MAGARHGMCELTRHGMAGKRHGMCELALKELFLTTRNVIKFYPARAET
jgi:hypothetical protein